MRIVAKKKDIAQNRLDGYFWIMEKVLRIRYPFRYAINLQSAEPEPTQQSLALWFPVVVKNPSVKKELCVGERYCSKSVGWILLRYGKSGFEFAIRPNPARMQTERSKKREHEQSFPMRSIRNNGADTMKLSIPRIANSNPLSVI